MISVQIFPGRDTPVKRYKAYFPKINLITTECDIALCHSRGIEQALKSNAKFIIAMDPSEFPINCEKCFIWSRKGRDIPDQVLNLKEYSEQTHYPYQVRRIRNEIVELIQSLAPRETVDSTVTYEQLTAPWNFAQRIQLCKCDVHVMRPFTLYPPSSEPGNYSRPSHCELCGGFLSVYS